MSVCFPGNALTYDLMNLPTLAFINATFESGAAIFWCASCLAMERRRIGLVKLNVERLGNVASCASLWASVFPGIFEWPGDH